MKVEYLLAKLNAKSSLPDGGGGGSDFRATSPLDVAGALGMGLEPSVYWFARAKYCLDGGAAAIVNVMLAKQIAEFCADQGWKLKPGQAYGLASLVVVEQVEPPKCGNCNGRGQYRHKDVVQDCKRCEGTGRVAIKNFQRAAIAHIPHSTYRKYWVDRVRIFESWVLEWDSQLARHLKKQLKEI